MSAPCVSHMTLLCFCESCWDFFSTAVWHCWLLFSFPSSMSPRCHSAEKLPTKPFSTSASWYFIPTQGSYASTWENDLLLVFQVHNKFVLSTFLCPLPLNCLSMTHNNPILKLVLFIVNLLFFLKNHELHNFTFMQIFFLDHIPLLRMKCRKAQPQLLLLPLKEQLGSWQFPTI